MCQLSIIIPVYQAEKSLADTIESVVSIIQQGIEILLINDGSSDSSIEICRKYEKQYSFIHLFSQRNKGVSAARNAGIEKACGKYVMFLDSDDELSKNSLPSILSIIDKQRDVSLVIFGFRYVYPDTFIEQIMNIDSGFYKLDEIKNNFFDWYESRILHNIGTKVYQRTLLLKNRIRFSEDKSYLEDITFCLDYLACVEKFYYINDSYYEYRMENSQSLSSGYKEDYLGAFQFMLGAVERLLGHSGISEEIFNKITLTGFADIFVHEILNQRENIALFEEISGNEGYYSLYKKYKGAFGFKYRCILRILFMKCRLLRRGVVRGLIGWYAKR